MRRGARWVGGGGGLHAVRAQPSPIMIYIVVIGARMSTAGVIAQTFFLPCLVTWCTLTLWRGIATFFFLSSLNPPSGDKFSPAGDLLLEDRRRKLCESTPDASITAAGAGGPACPRRCRRRRLHPHRNAVSSGVTRLNPGETCVMEPLMKELCPIEPYNECSDIENPMGGLLNS